MWSNNEEGVDKQKIVRLIIDNEKQDPFQFVSVWLWSSKRIINLYIFE